MKRTYEITVVYPPLLQLRIVPPVILNPGPREPGRRRRRSLWAAGGGVGRRRRASRQRATRRPRLRAGRREGRHVHEAGHGRVDGVAGGGSRRPRPAAIVFVLRVRVVVEVVKGRLLGVVRLLLCG